MAQEFIVTVKVICKTFEETLYIEDIEEEVNDALDEFVGGSAVVTSVTALD